MVAFGEDKKSAARGRQEILNAGSREVACTAAGDGGRGRRNGTGGEKISRLPRIPGRRGKKKKKEKIKAFVVEF